MSAPAACSFLVSILLTRTILSPGLCWRFKKLVWNVVARGWAWSRTLCANHKHAHTAPNARTTSRYAGVVPIWYWHHSAVDKQGESEHAKPNEGVLSLGPMTHGNNSQITILATGNLDANNTLIDLNPPGLPQSRQVWPWRRGRGFGLDRMLRVTMRVRRGAGPGA